MAGSPASALLLALVACGVTAGQDRPSDSAPATRPDPAAPPLVVRGRVLDERFLPLAGVAVREGLGEDLTTDDAFARPHVRSSADGSFALTMARPVVGEPDGFRSLLLAAPGRVAVEVQSLGHWRLVPRSELDLGDFVLVPGVTRSGRVRTAEGQPVVGARVSAFDRLPFGAGPPITTARHASHTRTGADGRFTVTGVFPDHGRLRVEAPGCYTLWVATLAEGMDLQVEPSGWITGTARGADGLEGPAFLRVAYEGSDEPQLFTAGGDGSFRVPVRHRGQLRIVASTIWYDLHHPLPRVRVEAESRLLFGPAQEVVVQAPAERVVRVRASTREGRAILGFQAALQQSVDLLPGAEGVPSDAHGTAWLVRPAPEDMPDDAPALVHVLAPRFAPGACPLPKDGADLQVTLDPESIVAGRVLDARTRAPIAGVDLTATNGPTNLMPFIIFRAWNPITGRFTRSGTDGAFRFTGLEPGSWRFTASSPTHEGQRSVEIAGPGTRETTDILFEPRPGRVLRWAAAGPPPGARVEGSDPVASVMYAAVPIWLLDHLPECLGRPVPITPWTRIADCYDPQLQLPMAPRWGPPITLQLAHAPKDQPLADLTIAAQDLAPTRLRVKVRHDTKRAGARLLVIATQGGVLWHAEHRKPLPPIGLSHRAVVDASGHCELSLGPALYFLRVVDLATGVPLSGETKVRLRHRDDQEVQITLALAQVTVTLTAEGPGGPPAAALELWLPDAERPAACVSLRGAGSIDLLVPARAQELRAVTAAVPGFLWLPSRILATHRFDPTAGPEQGIRLVCR